MRAKGGALLGPPKFAAEAAACLRMTARIQVAEGDIAAQAPPLGPLSHRVP